MKHKMLNAISPIILAAVLAVGCTAQKQTEGAKTDTTGVASQLEKTDSTTSTAKQSEAADSGEVDMADAVKITLSGNSISADSEAVRLTDSTATITKEGTYIISGTLDNGSLIVNAGKEETVRLVLNGVTIASKTFAPIYVQQADKVHMTLTDGTKNTLANGGTFTNIDDNDVDAVIFSKDDLILNGAGSLTVESPAGHGIVGKDELTITNGAYEMTVAKTAIKAKDSLTIAAGTFTLKADADGLHAENNDDESLGSIYIRGGKFNISAGDDGIHATTSLVVDGGAFDITAVEGVEATRITINDGEILIQASDDGINASEKTSLYTPTVEVNGGTTNIVMGAGDTDGVDANGDIIINGGIVNVTGNSAFDFDGSGTLNGGTVTVNGKQITELTNQMMGGPGGMGGFGGMEPGRGKHQ
ncbi:MAG: carbohydrate-binding domain-containing protein [Lachnospiraceae bacterium]|nr:carbohydrate-binding domain-containing protein [Lachnospiraceae bacterium]MDY5741817.1 carbohydrate-binding domain-containing protein [Lachnospiraceae bacterium]